MDIVIVSQHFFPDTFRINDIAFTLRAEGHRVRVLTGLPDYDTGRLPAAYRLFRKRRETVEGVEILRVPTTRRRTGAAWRLINYVSFAAMGWLCASFLRKSADIVLTYETSPVSQAIPAIRLARRSRCPHILYCLDLWPEVVQVWNVREESTLYRWIRRISGAIYRAADWVPVCSQPFADYMAGIHHVAPERIRYLPQHCEAMFEEVAGQYEDNGVTDFLFAGNIGAAQDIPCLVAAVARLREMPEGAAPFHVHIVGDGTALADARAQCEALGLGTLITFYGRKPLAEMPAFYRKADAFLLLLTGEGFVSQTLPGKLQGYLSAGKPIVAAIDGAGAQVLREADCGPCAPASDAEALARCMAQVVAEPSAFRVHGERAQQYYRQHFRKDVFMENLHALMQEALDARGTSRGMEKT